MPSGGYLIFEQTEAMYVVDVNSGRYAAKKAQEDNSLRTNLEAAREIAKQLRLRDIGGIIVVDFIDLQDDGNRKKVYDELKKEFRKDRAKTNLLPMSDFGLVQITRQRIRPSVVKSVSLVCPMCGGSGSIVSQNTVLSDIEAWLSKYVINYKKRSIDLYVNPYFHSLLTRGIFSQRLKWVFKYRVNIALLPDESVSLNEYKVMLMGTEVEITQTVQESLKIEDAVRDAEKRLAELESEGQRDDSLLDYGGDEKNGGKDASDRDKPARRSPAPSRQQQRDKPEPRKPAPSPAAASRGDDSGRKSSRDEEEDERKSQRQDSRRSNVKSKYYKSRDDEEAGDADTGKNSRTGSASKPAPDVTESSDTSPKTDSNGEPLRNAEDVAREYRERRLREEAEQKSGQEQETRTAAEQPAEKVEVKTASSGTAAKTDKTAMDGNDDEKNSAESAAAGSDTAGTETEKPKSRRARPKKAEQEDGESVKKKSAARKPAAKKSAKSDKSPSKGPKGKGIDKADAKAETEVETAEKTTSESGTAEKAD